METPIFPLKDKCRGEGRQALAAHTLFPFGPVLSIHPPASESGMVYFTQAVSRMSLGQGLAEKREGPVLSSMALLPGQTFDACASQKWAAVMRLLSHIRAATNT